MSMEIAYRKASGIGNDFLIIDRRQSTAEITPEIVRKLADRQAGVGCDQVITLNRPNTPTAEIALSFVNSDGTPSNACGNGLRCAAQLLFSETGKSSIHIQTAAGVRLAKQTDAGLVTAAMGHGLRRWGDVPLSSPTALKDLPHIPGTVGQPMAVNIGNPHVIFVALDADSIDLPHWGSLVENHSAFPEKANVGFLQILSPTKLKLRVWERGAGATQACGTGACAAAYACYQETLCEPEVTVHQRGGDLLIHLDSENQIWMTGPAILGEEGVWRG